MALKTNKVVYGGQTLIDLTADTVTPDKLLSGYTAHDKSGEIIEGSCTFDVNSQDATVAVAEMLINKTAYARGTKLTGTMPNRSGANGEISTVGETYTIQQGYHDGSGKVGISATEKTKLVAENIREGVTILGVLGTMSGSESEAPQESKEVTPSNVSQIITPSEGYTCLRQVIVKPIPYVESQNSAGGITVTIG